MNSGGLPGKNGTSALWRWAGWLLAAMTITFIGLIAGGVFDPRPVGQLSVSHTPGDLNIPARDSAFQWQSCATPANTFSIRGVGAHTSGEQDIVYGVAIGDQEEFLAVGVSPLGYVTIRHNEILLLPLQTWPHVQAQENEIWIDMRQGDVSVRINRELLWQDTVDLPAHSGAVWGESFANEAAIHFATLSCFTPDGS